MERLADRIARDGPLKELDAVGWAVRLAKRIEAMHAAGAVHGAVSPEALSIASTERSAAAVLVDLGSKPQAPMGYRSPQRIAGETATFADDIWGIGATLYAALTGSAPFTGADDAEIGQRVRNATMAPLAVFDAGDDDLQRIIDDALTRDAQQRTRSVTALREALERWHPDETLSALPPVDPIAAPKAAVAPAARKGIVMELREDDEDERTVMRTAPAWMASPMAAARSAPARDDIDDPQTLQRAAADEIDDPKTLQRADVDPEDPLTLQRRPADASPPPGPRPASPLFARSQRPMAVARPLPRAVPPPQRGAVTGTWSVAGHGAAGREADPEPHRAPVSAVAGQGAEGGDAEGKPARPAPPTPAPGPGDDGEEATRMMAVPGLFEDDPEAKTLLRDNPADVLSALRAVAPGADGRSPAARPPDAPSASAVEGASSAGARNADPERGSDPRAQGTVDPAAISSAAPAELSGPIPAPLQVSEAPPTDPSAGQGPPVRAATEGSPIAAPPAPTAVVAQRRASPLVIAIGILLLMAAAAGTYFVLGARPF